MCLLIYSISCAPFDKDSLSLSLSVFVFVFVCVCVCVCVCACACVRVCVCCRMFQSRVVPVAEDKWFLEISFHELINCPTPLPSKA